MESQAHMRIVQSYVAYYGETSPQRKTPGSPTKKNRSDQAPSSPTKKDRADRVTAWLFNITPHHRKSIFQTQQSSFKDTASKINDVQCTLIQYTQVGLPLVQHECTNRSPYKKQKITHIQAETTCATIDSVDAKKRPASPTQKSQEHPKTSLLKKLHRAVRTINSLSRGVKEGATRLHESYFLEALTSDHFYGQDTEAFKKIWAETEPQLNFIDWFTDVLKKKKVHGTKKLQEAGLLNNELEIVSTLRKVKYLLPDERKNYKAYINEDKEICTPEQCGPLDSELFAKENPYIFVIGRDKELYVGVYQRGEIHHSSFFAGSPVMSAGMMIFNKGKLIKITDKTGHYTVSKELIQKGLEILHNKGFDLENVTVSLNSWTGCPYPPEQHKAVDLLNEWMSKKA